MRSAILTPVLAAALLSLPRPAVAEWLLYGGLGVGYSGIEVEQEPLEPVNFPGESLSRDLEGSAFTIQPVVGLRYGQYVGLEANYFHYDTFKDDAVPPTPDFPIFPPFPVLTYSADIEGYTLYVTGFWPLNQDVEAFGKIGIVSWDAELQGRLADFRDTSEADGEDMAFGLGLDYLATGPLRVRFEAQFLDLENTSLNWNVIVSAIYSFRFGD